MSESHTLIVGGGIVGVCAAYFLASRGQRVTLLEKETIEDSASTGNAGLISVGHGPLPKPGLTGKAVRWMLSSNSPLYIKPRFDPALFKWFWNFRRACTPQAWQANMKVLTDHGLPAGDCIRQLVEEENLDCEYCPVGQLDVFATEEGMAGGVEEAKMMRECGYDVDELSGDELRKREPAFRDSVYGATLYTQRAFADPGRFVTGVAEAAKKHGADIQTGRGVAELLNFYGRCTGVKTNDGESIEADTVVLAAGIWSSALARHIGLKIPMQPAKGYHLNLEKPDPCTSTACVLMERYVAVTPMGDYLRLAGTLELSGINHRIRENRLAMLRRGANMYLHGIDQADAREQWCGLRPCTADGLPVVDWAPKVGHLFIATGHAMMGFLLGPITGRLVSECILDGKPSLDITRLKADRFG
jgi:D-amino-acid dehydrogenase